MATDFGKIECVNCHKSIDGFSIICPNCGKNPTSIKFDPTQILPDYLSDPTSVGLNLILEKSKEEIEKESEKLKEKIKYLEEKSEKEVADVEKELDSSQKQTAKMKNALKKMEAVYEKESKKPLTKNETKDPYLIDEKAALYDKLIKRLKRIRKNK